MLEEVVDAGLFEQAADEVEVGLVVLDAVLQHRMRLRQLELEGGVVVLQHRTDDLLDGLELGLAAPQGQDTTPGAFAADEDPDTVTNPLNADKYIVLNSGFTFREYDYLNNARQVPKLPDYAVIDLNIPVSSRLPGGIATAGFFGERWELLPGGTK